MMAKRSVTWRNGWSLGGWGTRDLLVVAAIGVALGAAQIPFIYVNLALQTAGPVVAWTITGLFVIPNLMALSVMRRRGAGLISGIFVGLVQTPFNPAGWVIMSSTLLFGLGAELPFLFTRYKKGGLAFLVAAGALACLPPLAFIYVPLGLMSLSVTIQLGIILTSLLSGALLGGLLTKLLTDALARTGVLSGYAIGRERRGEA
jgi:energy-coupling factor transport system substrate-specific component